MMFGKNEIVGQRYFKEAKEDELFVTSMFVTLQGEGPYAGMPAVFIRLAKCNLACSFCDTFFDDGDWMTFEEIDWKIDKLIEEYFEGDVPDYAHGPFIHVGSDDVEGDLYLRGRRQMVLVLTGGEPSLQKNIGPFLDLMNMQFQHTQIESNGIVYQDTIPAETTLVVSPKCLEKDGKAVRYIKPNLKTMERADCLKFVMEADPESPYSEIPDWAINFDRTVYVSPMNIYNDEPKASKELRNSGKNQIDMEERSNIDEVISFWSEGLLDMKSVQANHEYTSKYAITNGLRFQMQLHLFASLA